jgi:Protein of unknown function (DUF2892)
MQCNVGKWDRIARIVMGSVVLAVGLYFESWLCLLGVMPLYTVTIAWCPKFLFCAMPSQKRWHRCCAPCC